MNLQKVWLASILVCASSLHAQQAPNAASPIVPVQLKPAPSQLKKQIGHRRILSCGTALFGVNASSIWVMSLGKGKGDSADVMEIWQPSKRNTFRLLQTLNLPPLSPLFPPNRSRSLDSDDSLGIKLRWLFPAQRRGPVVVSPVGYDITVYTFEKGWHDPKPITQQLKALSNEEGDFTYAFDSVNKQGTLQGSVYVAYHPTSPESNPGEIYSVQWESGKGWK